MTDELFDLDDEGLDSDEDPFEGIDTPAKPAVRTLEEFEAAVDANIKVLMSPKNSPAARRDAALWLGSSGAPKAITALTKVYEKDKKNKDVQAAAAYALGQFKALDEAIVRDDGEPVTEALGREENEGIVALLEGIALRDERGKPLRVKTRTLVMLQGMLAVLLVILVVANLVVSGNQGNEASSLAMRGTGAPIQRAINEVGLRTDELESDAEALQEQFTNAENSVALNCVATFNDPASFGLDSSVAAQYPDANTLIERYNALQLNFTQAKLPFSEACAANARDVSPEDLTASLALLENVLDELPTLKADIDDYAEDVNDQLTATAAVQATNQSVEATSSVPTEIPTDTPVPTATPGLAANDLNRHIGAMIGIIDEATGQRGFNTLLTQYWTEARDRGATNGCNLAAPTIPEDYVLTDEEKAVAPQLADAAVQLNTGLALARTGWTFFATSCTNGTIANNVQLGLDTTTTAKNTFDTAFGILETLRGS